ncbi:4Fe-4S dicluster domain-containing protein [Clostridium sp.]|jgi:[FeFe] hydrogenase (group B1/B3)|uniref:4Fe-4S dicluster domain-containing protein n=1 Tax=Clostridium sp. TaxID=1506 RepID=UPI003A5C410E
MKYEYKTLADIRHKVFTAVSKIAFNGNLDEIANIPYEIVGGDVGKYRQSAFLERAIVSERVRLAMGLNLRPSDKPRPITEGIEQATKPSKYYEPPLINIIKFACNACPTKSYEVTNMCRGCLAHPCVEVCPKNAISIVNGKSFIDQDKCIKCGLCAKACPYSAIIKHERPCASACGMDAISSDENGRADIDYDKCVSCGMCLVNCPFGAISDKSQIYQLIQAIKQKNDVIAIVAPSYLGQFGKNVGFDDFKEAMIKLGFKDVVEVAIGADICTIDEAKDFIENVPKNLSFMATSCCPAWSVMAKKSHPDHADNVSMALTPMVFAARLVREKNKDAKIVFIGPCSAKKLEASRKSVKSEVDFVITFEELSGMLDAKGIKIVGTKNTLNNEATASGRGFAVAGGVAEAVSNLIKKQHPDREVKIKSAAGLKECRKMFDDAVKGKYDGYLLEGMACPEGCVSGAGCIAKPNISGVQVKIASKKSELKVSDESKYADKLYLLHGVPKK